MGELVKLQKDVGDLTHRTVALEDKTNELEKRVAKIDEVSFKVAKLAHEIDLQKNKMKVIEMICSNTEKTVTKITTNQADFFGFMNKFKGGLIVAGVMVGAPAIIASLITIFHELTGLIK